ncbi:MAG: hypothetical protein ACI4J7_11060 [Ruminiclostridium sp.]
MDEKEKIISIPKPKEESPDLSHDDNWVTDMKSDMEEYIEEQGIYIRQ